MNNLSTANELIILVLKMSEVDGWTNKQIREKFEELGSPAPPITATTKKFMIKRIKAHLERGGNPITKPHEDPEPEEEDEPDAPPLPPTRIPRRLGRSALAAMNQTNQSMNITDSLSPILNGDGDSNKTRSKSPGRKSVGREPAPPSPGRSFGRMEPSPVPPSPPRQLETRTRSPGRKSLGRASDFMTPEADEENQRPPRKVTPSRRNPESEDVFTNQRGVSPSRISSSIFGSTDLRKSAERIMQEARESVSREAIANEAFRSRLLDSASSLSPATFESNFMKRLSTPIRANKYSNMDDDDELSEDEDELASPVRVTRGNKPSGYEVRSGKGERVFPVALFFAFLIPFTILVGFFALFYSAPKTTVEEKFVFPVCTGSTMEFPGRNCVEEVDRAPVESLFKAFIDGFTQIRLDAPCSTSQSQPVFVDNNSIKEIIATSDDRISVWLVEKKLNELKVLFDANPYLNIRSKTDGIALISGPDTFICQLWSKIVLLAEWIIKIAITAAVAVLSKYGIQWYLTKQQKFKEDVAFAVDKVVDLTKTRKFLGVEQMEKELLSFGFSKDVIAEAFNVASRDSRLNLDSINNVSGLRWVGETSTSSVSTPWTNNYGEIDRMTAHLMPPTACLKIRGMFAPARKILNNEDIMQLVDTILEKSTGNRIVHIVVDRKSPDGIVYLRGLTRSDAGGVFKNLNNSIYEGRPISIKFVREARYDEKFPDSARCTRPLRPSSQK
ncbi:hypothetical protein GE061_003909 [Apolygus lucorum]|uniref:LEM domain-containing protein n=1 Tax=Apolygus lucorum TaxID=248454 RepID=A0A8S9WZH0_APOLU|nr:hypothetical protein GE061_003909 [Apolygus lucorum]